jgi:hypothetical protein
MDKDWLIGTVLQHPCKDVAQQLQLQKHSRDGELLVPSGRPAQLLQKGDQAARRP